MAEPFKHLSYKEVEQLIAQLGFPKYRTLQILKWVYETGVSSYDEMSNLPKAMRLLLVESCPLVPATMVDRQISIDGSRKYLIELEGNCLVETVALPKPDGRLSVCVSTQSGCAMACSFCATGKSGLNRSLYCGEIVDQVLVVQKDLNRKVTNVVFMGQGEPFSNYNEVLEGMHYLNHSKLLNIGARHMTVSTCGLTSGIEKLSSEPLQITLAVSLHSAIQETRDYLMPHVANQTLPALKRALKAYSEKTGRRFSFEYALMKGINDSDAELDALCSYCKGLLCHVNLIPLNEIPDSTFKPVEKRTMIKWRDCLEKQGIACSIRKSMGSDIDGACGQLAAKLR